ncbi:MAG: methyl-accepting chemotaxis protein [Rhodocyclaceae bacterium]|nr:methyl-accepting chemotaxis protein [Rhodocyclaceae bacterium]
MNHLSIKTLLALVLGFMALMMAGGGAVGIGGIAVTHASLEATYRDRLEPAVILSHVVRLMNDNRVQIMLSLQHDPTHAFAKAHDHPLSKHTETISKNRDEITALWKDYNARNLVPEERALADKYAAARARYVTEGLQAAMEAVNQGDFNKTNEILLSKVNPLYVEASGIADTLLTVTLRTAREEYEHSLSRYEFVRALAVGGTVLGVLLAFLAGVFLIRSIVTPLRQMASQFDHIAQGKLNNAIPEGHDNEIGQCFNALAKMQQGLREAMTGIAQSSARISGYCGTLQVNIEQVTLRSDQQLDRARDVAVETEETSQSIAEVAANAKTTVDAAVTAQDIVRISNQQMVESMGSIGKVVHGVEMSSKTIREITTSVARVDAMSHVIKEIADQTNLLALNAAIEAARAGEAGRGFAVVADEVRKLAERTALSTTDISNMVADIQSISKSAVESIEQAGHEVDASIASITATSDTIFKIMTATNEVTDMAQQIAAATSQQSVATQEMAHNVEQLSQLVAENNLDTQSARQSTTGVMKEVDELRTLIKRFEL